MCSEGEPYLMGRPYIPQVVREKRKTTKLYNFFGIYLRVLTSLLISFTCYVLDLRILS